MNYFKIKRNRMLHIISFLALVLLLSTLIGCEKNTAPNVLKIGSMPTQTASIYAIGIEKGIFAEHNLAVDLTIFPSALERDSAATAGVLDGFLTDIMGAVNLREHGFNFVITSSEYENFCIMSRSPASQASAKISGKIGIANNTVTEYVANQLIESPAIELINIPKVPERLAALLSDKITYGVFPEPFVSIIQEKGGLPVLSSAAVNLQPVVFVFSEEVIGKTPKLAKDFYSAYNDIIDYMKNTPYDEYKSILVKYKLISPELNDKIKLPLSHFSHAKEVSEEDVSKVLGWMMKKSMIKTSYTYKDLINSEIVK